MNELNLIRRGCGFEATAELYFEADVDIGDSCPADIVVTKTDGVIQYPKDDGIDPPVNIISRQISSVTVEMKTPGTNLSVTSTIVTGRTPLPKAVLKSLLFS
jgi:hypothetical protein